MTAKADALSTAASVTPPDVPRAPRAALAWASLVYAICTVALGYPALAGKFLVNPHSDQYFAGYAFREFARSYFVEHGSVPQWNPYLHGGMPFIDAMHGDTFYPTALLRILLGTDVGMTWGFIIHIFLAGLFTYVFLRSLGLSFFAALVGGVAYQMGGNVAGLVSPGHDGKIFVATLLPLALYLVVRGVRDGRHSAWGPLALVCGLAVLSPHPQLYQYMLLVTGSFALFLALGFGSDKLAERRQGLKRLALALGSVGIGTLLGAIQYWPVMSYVAWSPRAGGKPWDHAVSYSMPPEEMLNFAVPQFSGMLDSYSGRNGIHFHSEYIGITVLVLAGLAFGAWAAKSYKRLVWFWLGAFVVSLLWALGGYTPFFSIIYAIVPGTKYFRAPSTMLMVVSFCAAILAALGAERVLRGGVSKRYLVGWGVVAVLIAMLGLSGALSNLAVSFSIQQFTDRAFANEGTLRVGALRSTAFALLAVAAIWMVATRRLSRDLAGVLLVLVVAVDLWTVLRKYWLFMEPASVSFASNSVIEYIRKQPQPFRVLTNATPTLRNFRDPDLRYAGLMAHGVAQVLGYHGNQLRTYDLLTGGEPEFPNIGNPNFWQLANMRYIMTDAAEAMNIPGIKQVAGPARNAAGNDVYLYELPGTATYAWVTPVIVKADEASVLQTVLDPRFDVRTVALFDTSAQVEGKEISAVPPPLSISASVARYEPGKATIVLDQPAPAGSALVVSENYYPGWTATVDGKPATVGRADVSLIGVALPEGAKTIELSFQSLTYATGKAVTLFVALIAIAAWIAGLLIDRRRPAGG